MLKLEHLTTSLNAFRLGPLDLTVGHEVVAVLGPSGCGKTTLLKLIAGLVPPDAGILSLNGQPFGSLPPEQRGAALVFQEGASFPHLSARQNIAYAASSPEKVEALAELLAIEGVLEQPARTLSGGERRRVEVARALAANPDVLLLDEPTTALDAPIRHRLRQQLRAVFSDLAIPVLYVTHDQDEAAAVADRVAVMHDGRIHQTGSPTAIFERPATPFVASFTGNPNVLPARLVQKAPRPLADWDGLHLYVPNTSLEVGEAAWLCIRPEQIRLEPLGSTRARLDETSGDASVNTFDARIEEHVFEGSTYILTVTPGGADASHRTLEAKVLPSTFHRLRQEACVRVHLAPQTLHLIPHDSEAKPRGAENEAHTEPDRLPL